MVSKVECEQRLAFALDIAESLSQYQREVTQQNLSCERKSDGTPVTVVDCESERRFREAVMQKFPQDGILGEEEGGSHQSQQPGRWVIDPIDGTRKFMHGLPFWGICLAYEWEGEVQIGVMVIPGAHLVYSAIKGQGAFCNGKPITVKDAAPPEHTILTMPPRPCFVAEGWGPIFDGVQNWIEHDPGFLDAYSYGMVADGRIHGLLSCGDKWWDIAAAVCIIREAGGIFSNLKGQEPAEGELNLAATPKTADWLIARIDSLGIL